VTSDSAVVLVVANSASLLVAVDNLSADLVASALALL
jgi:hypothetical protein